MTARVLDDKNWPMPRELVFFALIVVALAVGVFSDGPMRVIFLGTGLAAGALMPFAGLLAIALTVWVLPLMEIGAVVSDIRADELLLAVVAVSVFIRVLVRRDWRPSRVEWALLVFLATLVIGAAAKYAFGWDMPLRAVAVPIMRHGARLLLFAVTLYLLEGRSARSTMLVAAMTVGGLLAAVLGIVQYHSLPVHNWIVSTFPTLDGASTYPYVPGGLGYRSMSTFDGNPNRFGVAMAVLALFATVMSARASGGGRPALPGIAWGLTALVFLTSLLFTTSRSSFLAAAAMLLVAALLITWRTPLFVFSAWIVIALVVPNVMLARVLDLFGTRTTTGVVPDPSVSGRLDAIIESAPERAGTVLPTYDNFYVDVTRNFGAVALLGLLVLVWIVTARLLRATRSSTDGRWFAIAGLLAWGVLLLVSFTGAFFSIARVSEIVWMLVAVGLSSCGAGPALSSARAPADTAGGAKVSLGSGETTVCRSAGTVS